MSIIFDYLFIRTETGFVCRVPVSFEGVQKILRKGASVDSIDTPGIDLNQWVGKNLKVSITEGVYTVSGLI